MGGSILSIVTLVRHPPAHANQHGYALRHICGILLLLRRLPTFWSRAGVVVCSQQLNQYLF
jgi:hypothetical protein